MPLCVLQRCGRWAPLTTSTSPSWATQRCPSWSGQRWGPGGRGAAAVAAMSVWDRWGAGRSICLAATCFRQLISACCACCSCPLRLLQRLASVAAAAAAASTHRACCPPGLPTAGLPVPHWRHCGHPAAVNTAGAQPHQLDAQVVLPGAVAARWRQQPRSIPQQPLVK